MHNKRGGNVRSIYTQSEFLLSTLTPDHHYLESCFSYSDDSLEYNARKLPQMTANFLRILFS